ncbi:MAG: hypothetical protein DIU80_006390 [Chloroflexota bacterium]
MSSDVRPRYLAGIVRHPLPAVALLQPGRWAFPAAVAFAIGLAVSSVAYALFRIPTWAITVIVLLALLPVGVLKWREDRRRYGTVVMLLSVILITQGLHTVEHIVQWVQYYILMMPARQSTGLVSAANSEWVHFVWNWWVLLVVAVLVRGGMRGWLAMLLLAVTVLHAVEHTYLFVRHYMVLNELRALNITTLTAQGLPGIIGQDGWLARSPVTQGTFLCTLPGLTTAPRLDVHFWWNLIEMLLLLGAGHVFLRRLPQRAAVPVTRV